MYAHPLKEFIISQVPDGTIELFSVSGNYGMSVMKMAIMLVQREEGVISASVIRKGTLNWWHLSW